MAVRVIASSLMTSDDTAHVARCVGGDRWVVSWLPGRTVSGTQAVAAMSIAAAVGRHGPSGACELVQLDAPALELGLTLNEAACMVGAEHHDYRCAPRSPGLTQP